MPLAQAAEEARDRLLSAAAAVPQASIASGTTGTALLLAAVIVLEGLHLSPFPSIELAFELFGGTMIALTIAMIASFVCAFYIVVFGLPLVLLLGPLIRKPWALGLALVDAAFGALLATSGERTGLLSGGALPLVLCYAIPAGYFYRRFTVNMRDWRGLA